MKPNMPIKSFNSGRQYSAAGQRIYYRRVDDVMVMFFDVDRHISRIVAFAAGGDEAGKLMREYDNMRYRERAEDYNALRAFEEEVWELVLEEA